MFIKRLDEDLKKFDAIYNEGMFLGYYFTKKAYRCYNFRLHKIVDCADVKVDDLKTRKFKYQDSILDDESEYDEEPVNTQTDVEEEEEIQEDETSTKEEDDNRE